MDSKAQEDETYIQSEVFNDEKGEVGEKNDEDDANSEMDQLNDIHNDEKWDTDIEQEGGHLLFFLKISKQCKLKSSQFALFWKH